jgi:hypothetical protein
MYAIESFRVAPGGAGFSAKAGRNAGKLQRQLLRLEDTIHVHRHDAHF